jgi:hypothetical protein
MVKNDRSNNSFLSENKYYIQSNHHVPKLWANSRLDWSGGMLLDLRSKQTLIASYFNNMKQTKHIYLVYLVHCGPNFNHLVIDEVSNSGKANHPAIHHKEDMSIDKEDIDANVHLLMELN